MISQSEAPRVAFIAGTLARGGAERQMMHMANSLRQAGAQVRVCSLTRDEYYQKVLEDDGFRIAWVGRFPNPVARVAAIVSELRPFRPHVLQSMHSFANLYAALPARALNALSVGALRCEPEAAARTNGNWMKWLMRVPDAVLVNSENARQQLADMYQISLDRVHYVANRVDTQRYGVTRQAHSGIVAIFVGRLVAAKRIDCFLNALAAARKRCPSIRGVVAGDGPYRAAGEKLAAELRLLPDHVEFLGARDDLPAWLSTSDMLVMCSESEGSANVLLEAMAAHLPVIATPAGDASTTVQHGTTGFLVRFGDVQDLAERMIQLAEAPDLRQKLGNAGRAVVEKRSSLAGLSNDLYRTYARIARHRGNRRLTDLKALEQPDDGLVSVASSDRS